jgi:hypothetical protein
VRWPIALLAAFCLIPAFSFAAEVEEDEVIIEKGIIPGGRVYFGLAYPFMNFSQFEDDLDQAGLDDFSMPLGLRFGLGGDFLMGRHEFLYNVDFNIFDMDSHKNGRYAYFLHMHSRLSLGYGYYITDWMRIGADFGFGVARYQYAMTSPDLDGHVKGIYYPLEPEVSISFRITDPLWVKLYGGYHTSVAEGGQINSGDFRPPTWDDMDLDFFYLGIGLDWRF